MIDNVKFNFESFNDKLVETRVICEKLAPSTEFKDLSPLRYQTHSPVLRSTRHKSHVSWMQDRPPDLEKVCTSEILERERMDFSHKLNRLRERLNE